MEILPGIHRIDGVSGANSYLVIGKDGNLIIDTGMPGNAQKIADYIARTLKDVHGISLIVLTHSDIDHIGSAEELKRITGGRLAIGKEDAPVLSGTASMKKPKGILGGVMGIAEHIMTFKPAQPDLLLEDGDVINDFKVIGTPGHTLGSISLYLPGDVIIVGDALRSDSDGNPLLPSDTFSLDMDIAMDSVNKISGLAFDNLLAGHGSPVLGNASEKVKSLVGKE